MPVGRLKNTEFSVGDLTEDCIIRPARQVTLVTQTSAPQGETPMKRTVRAWFLMLAFVATYVAAAAPRVAAPDGGPLPLCPPRKGPNCSLNLN